jgi:Uma2 family endonuclease
MAATKSKQRKAPPHRHNGNGQPAWELAYLFPMQGQWTEEEYLALPIRREFEFVNGRLEALPMPTTSHELIVTFLYKTLDAFVTAASLGLVLLSVTKVRTLKDKIRIPDIIFVSTEHYDLVAEDVWAGADLVMEVVSGSQKDRDRDLRTKRREYALAGISEYWIVDPQKQRVTVLKLKGRSYVQHGRFGSGQRARSALLEGFEVDVDAVFAQGRRFQKRR